MGKKNKYSKIKKRNQTIAMWVLRSLSAFVVVCLFLILGFIVYKGFGVMSWEFLTSMPEDGMTKGGIYPAIVGTLCLIAGSIIFAFPIGILSGI